MNIMKKFLLILTLILSINVIAQEAEDEYENFEIRYVQKKDIVSEGLNENNVIFKEPDTVIIYTTNHFNGVNYIVYERIEKVFYCYVTPDRIARVDKFFIKRLIKEKGFALMMTTLETFDRLDESDILDFYYVTVKPKLVVVTPDIN